jgi:hypothetical protein
MRDGSKRKYALITMGDGDAERAMRQLDGQALRDQRLSVAESMW